MSTRASAATDLQLSSHLRAIPDQRLRRGIQLAAWSLLLVAVLASLSGGLSLRDLQRFASRHHRVLTEALGLDLKRPASDCSCRSFFLQVDMTALGAALGAASRDWMIAQIPGGATELEPLVGDGRTLRGSIEPPAFASSRSRGPTCCSP